MLGKIVDNSLTLVRNSKDGEGVDEGNALVLVTHIIRPYYDGSTGVGSSLSCAFFPIALLPAFGLP